MAIEHLQATQCESSTQKCSNSTTVSPQINAPGAEKQAQRKASRLSNSSVKLRRSCSSKQTLPIEQTTMGIECPSSPRCIVRISDVFFVFHPLLKRLINIVVSCNNTATYCNYKWIQNEPAWIYKWWRERHAVNGLKQHPAEAPRSLALRPSRMWNGPMKQPVVGHCQVSGRQWAERWAFSLVSDRGQAVTCWNSWPSASSRWSDYVIYVWFYHIMISNICGYDDMMQGWRSNLKIYNS